MSFYHHEQGTDVPLDPQRLPSVTNQKQEDVLDTEMLAAVKALEVEEKSPVDINRLSTLYTDINEEWVPPKTVNDSVESDRQMIEQHSYPNPQPRDPEVLAQVTTARNREDERKRLGNSKATDKDVEALLCQSVVLAGGQSPDAGSVAREALEAFQRLRKNKRRKRIKFWAGWVVFMLLMAGVVFAGWSVMPNYVVAGRYSVVSDCKIPFGEGEITGKRTYSYAYKSLFGYHLVDESTRLEKTEINIDGNKLTILGQEGSKWWRQNIGLGERGTVALKPAELYWFVSDKNTALSPHSGLCK